MYFPGGQQMDIRNVSGQPVQNKDSRLVGEDKGKTSERAETPSGIVNDIDISSVKNDWRVKVRAIESEIRSLEENVSRNQVRQEGLVRIQNELLAVSEDELPAIRQNIVGIIKVHSFNGSVLLDNFSLAEGRSPYEYAAAIEVEKNRIVEETKQFTGELKTKMLAKENVIYAANGISPANIDTNSLVGEIRDYIRSVNGSNAFDNARIKDLLS
jgi:hypothetical protein